MNTGEGYAGRTQSHEKERRLLLEHLPLLGRMLEIGTFHGVTAAIIADARPSAVIHSVDPFIPGYSIKPGKEELWRTNARANQELFVCDAQEFLADGRKERVEADLYDLVFVDGSHAHVDCLIDLIVADRLLRTGGVLAVHDYVRIPEDFTVKRAVEDFRRMRPAFQITHVKVTLAILEKAI